jgi:hypothetical protein
MPQIFATVPRFFEYFFLLQADSILHQYEKQMTSVPIPLQQGEEDNCYLSRHSCQVYNHNLYLFPIILFYAKYLVILFYVPFHDSTMVKSSHHIVYSDRIRHSHRK